MRKLICAILSVILLLGTAVTAWAEDTATLTITPDKTEVTANGSAVQVKFTIMVTPPEGRELGVFSFRLKPSGGMTLPGSFKENGEAFGMSGVTIGDLIVYAASLCGQRPAIRCDHRQGCVPDV